MTKQRLQSKQILAVAIALTLSSAALGEEFEYGLRLGATYSDNVERTSEDERSSAAGAAGLELRGERTTGRLRYDVLGDLEYQDYFESGVDSQTYGRVHANSSYAFVPETFEWLLSGAFDQVREDLLRPVAPTNLEDVITLSTGPRVTGRIGDAFLVQADAHYTIADYSERDFDSETVGALAILGRRMSERSFIGLGAAYDDVTYTSDRRLSSASDFERREYFLRFNTTGARTHLDADVGYAEIEGDTVDEDGPMARVRVTRQLTPYVSGHVGYIREFPTSEGAAAAPLGTIDVSAGDDSVLTPTARENQTAEIGVEMSRPRTTAALTYSWRREEAVGVVPVERDFDQFFASVSRTLTTRSRISFYATYSHEQISRVDSDATETGVGAEFNLTFGRAFGLDVRIAYRDRDAEPIGSYSEFSGGLFLRYGSALRFRPTQQTP